MKNLKQHVVLLLTAVLLVPLGNCQVKCTEEATPQLRSYSLDTSDKIRTILYVPDDWRKLRGEGKVGDVIRYVVNTKEEYEKFFSSTGKKPEIDFDKYTLLAGLYFYAQGGGPTEQNLYKHCNGYVYNVILKCEPGCILTPGAIPFCLLVDKIPSNANVIFNVNYQIQ